MHKLYFPACPVEGPIEPPVPFSHFGTRGAIPSKCGSCKLEFEGGCMRYMDKLKRYMHLDYGPCGISGPTNPVIYEDQTSLFVPRSRFRRSASGAISSFTTTSLVSHARRTLRNGVTAIAVWTGAHGGRTASISICRIPKSPLKRWWMPFTKTMSSRL